MLSPELLRDTLDTANLECWERERTATPVRAFAVRLMRPGVHSEKHKRFFDYSAYNVLTRRFFSGYIE